MTALLHPTMGETASCPTAPITSATWPWQATPAPAKPRCSKPCCMPAARSRRQAAIERGSTVSDFDPIEKQRGHSHRRRASPASTTRGIHVNLIDTPGYPDFRGPTLSALAAVETVRDRGRRRQRHRVRHAPDDGVRQGAQPVPRASSSTRSTTTARDSARAARRPARDLRPGSACRSTCPPTAARASSTASATPRGDSDLGPVADWHQKIIDQVVEINETVMDHYLDVGEDGLSGRGTARRLRAMPARGPPGAGAASCSARTGVGVKELLDVAEKLFPHPGEANPPPFVKGSGDDAQPIEAAARSEGACHRRRVQDRQRSLRRQARHLPRLPGHGEEGHAAVHRRRQEAVQGRRTCSSSRARTTSRSTQAIPGDIAAVAKIDDLHFDAVLHDSHDEDQIHLAPLDFPKPMFGLAIEAAQQGPGAEARHRAAQAGRGRSVLPSSSTRPRPTKP